jgi:hypothetical protein
MWLKSIFKLNIMYVTHVVEKHLQVNIETMTLYFRHVNQRHYIAYE